MENQKGSKFARVMSYILVAALASAITYFTVPEKKETTKLDEVKALIDTCFIGETDDTTLEDGAAAGMVAATGDQWSYYIPASEYGSYMEQMNNAYVGIGVTVSQVEDPRGYKVLQVEPGSGAVEAGILPGDVIYSVEGKLLTEIGFENGTAAIKGDENTQVELGIYRGDETLTLKVTRKKILVVVAEGKMLPDNIGLVTINNFDDRCAQETIAAIEELVEQGATALIFDVRFNPGGYKVELEKILDYLLPEGRIFHTIDYTGKEEFTESDAECLEMPMAVLMNGSSYSAAEFFAAALDEYDYAVLVGEPTTGKGYFQSTFKLSDGSAVGLSIGKYFTPVLGRSLAEEGGLVPEILVELDDETRANIYGDLVAPEDDPQIQAAIEALLGKS